MTPSMRAAALAVAISIVSPMQATAKATNDSPPSQTLTQPLRDDGVAPQPPSALSSLVSSEATQPSTASRPIKWDLNYIGEAAANPSGGIREDAAYAGQLYVGADVDLDRVFGIGGGKFHVAMTNRHGKNLSSFAIGNSTSVQEIYGLQNTHLARLSYEQHLFDGRLQFEIGRIVGNVETLASPLYCNFQSNAFCGNPTALFKNSNINGFPVSAWGARTKTFLTERINLAAAAYEVNPRQNQLSQHGFDFSFKGSKGVYIPIELGYSTTFKNDPRPRNYHVGIWFDRSPYNDPLFDSIGAAASVSGKPYARRFGRSSAWLRFDQMVTRPDPLSERGLSVFGTALAGVDGRNILSSSFSLGLLQMGTFPGREKDKIGFAVSDQIYSQAAVDNIRLARAARGASTDVPRHAFMLELNYAADLGPVKLMPNVQYIINPDQQSHLRRNRDIPDALVFGLKFSVDLLRVGSAVGVRS
jgi:porin